jgi:hypothetical protein
VTARSAVSSTLADGLLAGAFGTHPESLTESIDGATLPEACKVALRLRFQAQAHGFSIGGMLRKYS